MRAADFTMGRGRFLRSLFGIGAAVALGDDALELLDRLAPRRAMVRGVAMGYEMDAWYEAPFLLTDADLAAWDAGVTPLAAGEAMKALVNSMIPETMGPARLTFSRQYAHDVWSIDAVGAKVGSEPIILPDHMGPAINRNPLPAVGAVLQQYKQDAIALLQTDTIRRVNARNAALGQFA